MTNQPAGKKQGNSLSYSITVPETAPDPYLLVTIQVGSNCDDSAPPINLAEVQDANLTSLPLTSITSVTGTPCTGNTHSELFELRHPAPGTYQVVVAVAGIAPSLHSAAMVFAAVDPENPVRTTLTATGEGALTAVAIPSDESDLIVNTVGHGATIESVGPKQTELFRNNIDDETTLDNSGASIEPGTGAMVEMTWQAASVDQWQTISTALRVAP